MAGLYSEPLSEAEAEALQDVARRMHSHSASLPAESSVGAKLDSVADRLLQVVERRREAA